MTALMVLVAAIVAVSAALSAGQRMWAGHWRARTRIAVAALGGAFGPMTIPFTATLNAVRDGQAPAGALLVVFGIGAVLALVVALPVALVLGRKGSPSSNDTGVTFR